MTTWTRRTPAIVLVLVVAFVYLATASRAVLGGDNGEYASVFAQGGVPHPSGYPLFVVLLRALSWIPRSSAAHGASLVTAAIGVTAVGMIMVACRAWGASRGASVLTAATLAFSALMWKLSTHAEVFALNALIALAILAAVGQKFRLSGTGRAVSLATLAGLGLSGHHSIVLLAPIGIFGWIRGMRESTNRRLAVVLSLVGLAVGLLPYAYLVASADLSDGLVWGETSSLEGLVHHFLRRDYGTFTLAISDEGATAAAHVWRLGHALGTELYYAPMVIIVVGAWVLLGPRPSEDAAAAEEPAEENAEPDWMSPPEDWENDRISGLHETALRADMVTEELDTVSQEPSDECMPTRPGSWCLAISFLLAGPVFIGRFNLPLEGLSLAIVERFYLLPLVLLVIPLARGIDTLFGVWVRSVNVAGPATVAAVCLGIFVSYDAVREHHRPDVEYYLVNTLTSAEHSAIILGTGDHRLYGFWYVQAVRGHRPDVTYVDPVMLHYDWYRDRVEAALDLDLPDPIGGNLDTRILAFALLDAGRPLYLANRFTDSIVQSFATYPAGTLIRVLPPGARLPTPEELEQMNVTLALNYLYAETSPSDPDSWAGSVQFAYTRPWRVLAGAYEAMDRPADAERCRNRTILVRPTHVLAPLRD